MLSDLSYFSFKKVFVRLKLPGVKGNASIVLLTLESNSSGKYLHFVIAATLVLSIVSKHLNCPQNLGLSMEEYH